jgi:hypothetical protein
VRSEAFLRQVLDDELGVMCDLEPDSRRMIVTFAAFRGQQPVRHFAFYATLVEYDVKAAFLRDHCDAWYHRGVAGVGSGIDEVAEYLRGLAAHAEEVVMLGASSGAYAALLFGSLLGVEAHAFSPQTFIDPELRRVHRDRRFMRQFEGLGADMDLRYADLRPTLANAQRPLNVYYARGHPLDALHAERLGDLAPVKLHGFDVDTHLLARHLRDVGWLNPFLARLAQASPP